MCDVPERECVQYGAGDYFLLYTAQDSFAVSQYTAKVIDRQLARWIQPTWITFVTVTGSRVRVRTDRVTSLVQCSRDQRDAGRAFMQAVQDEDGGQLV